MTYNITIITITTITITIVCTKWIIGSVPLQKVFLICIFCMFVAAPGIGDIGRRGGFRGGGWKPRHVSLGLRGGGHCSAISLSK